MAQFYGTLQGSRGEASLLGTKFSGLETVAAGWNGAIKTEVFHRDGRDMYRVTLMPWQGSAGRLRVLAEGELNAALGEAEAAAAIGEDVG
jgi:hypothetical protein